METRPMAVTTYRTAKPNFSRGTTCGQSSAAVLITMHGNAHTTFCSKHRQGCHVNIDGTTRYIPSTGRMSSPAISYIWDSTESIQEAFIPVQSSCARLDFTVN
jgi:hypothetical protein